MLWGCSSGALKDMGDFDRIGTPLHYMVAGWYALCHILVLSSFVLTANTLCLSCSPTLIVNLWDVTDRDIDLFSKSVFEKMRMTPESVLKWTPQQQREGTQSESVVAAVAQSRDVCKLKYLTGAAPVVYGIPFYL